MRERTYAQAIAEALRQAMERDPAVFILGEYVDADRGIFGTTLEARDRFGKGRVIGTPIAENVIVGAGVGAAVVGMRPVLVFERNEFLLLAMDQIVNHAAKWRYMTGGKLPVPMVLRAVIGRGWGQGTQHSQSLQATFAHIPGLKVVMPATAADAKGLLLASIADDSPVLFLEHRWLHKEVGDVPEEPYQVPLGSARVVREGSDLTIVGISYMTLEALQTAEALAQEGIRAEVIDLRSVRPWDAETVLASVRKTGRLLIADTAQRTFGVSAEIAATVAERALEALRAPVARIGLPDAPTPCSPALEAIYYPGAKEIVAVARATVRGGAPERVASGPADVRKPFSGPF